MDPNVDIFKGIEDIVGTYGGLADQLGAVGTGIGLKIFSVLALLNFLWSGILWILHREDMAGIMGELIKKVFFIFFFYWLVSQYESWFIPLKSSFNYIAGQMVHASNVSGAMSLKPGRIMGRGMQLFSYIFMKGSNGPWFNHTALALLLIIFGCLTFYVFVRVGIEMMLIIIGGNIILAGGTFLLGFAGNPLTIKYAQQYINAAINLGIKFLFLVIIVSSGDGITEQWVARLEASTYQTLFRDGVFISTGSLIFYFMSIHVPTMAANMLGNGFVIKGNDFGFNAAQNTVIRAREGEPRIKTEKMIIRENTQTETIKCYGMDKIGSVNTLFGMNKTNDL
ncbi:MAG: type IV secretion system protein [Candidatus Omnitrophica bacterium]|nr:type IV secretion system protein [Candidatus Omnitrophota bacterium]